MVREYLAFGLGLVALVLLVLALLLVGLGLWEELLAAAVVSAVLSIAWSELAQAQYLRGRRP